MTTHGGDKMKILLITTFAVQFLVAGVSFAATQSLQCKVQESDGTTLLNYNLISQVARNDYEIKNTEIDVPSRVIPNLHINIYSFHSAAGGYPIVSVGRIYNDITRYEADSGSENAAPFTFGYSSISGVTRISLDCQVQ